MEPNHIPARSGAPPLLKPASDKLLAFCSSLIGTCVRKTL